ncbi:MAG: hypothetical protein U1D30_00850 [Planctomycetota bacterium]
MRANCFAILLAVGWGTSPGPSLGDGGAVRFHGLAGPYRVAVFTSPTPLRVGGMEVDVMVQDPMTDRLVDNVAIEADLQGAGDNASASNVFQQNHSTSPLYQSFEVRIPSAGSWNLRIQLTGPQGNADLAVKLPVGPPAAHWPELWAWISLPAVPIALFLFLWSGEQAKRRRGGNKSVGAI